MIDKKVIDDRFKRLKKSIDKINDNITILYSRLNTLTDEVNAISNYTSEVLKIVSGDKNYDAYKPIKLNKIEKKKDDEEYMSQADINSALKGIKTAGKK